ncbi:MAG: antibiotic biosynthesis monooxygenase [Bacteroidota bacterium]
MIARIWHGRTTVGKADAYMKEYFLKTGLADYEATEGNLGVLVLRKDEAGEADFLLLTLWESEAAIRKFAGEDINKARYYPEDAKYFTEMEENVSHYDVLIDRLAPADR